MHPFPVERASWKIYGNYKRICCGMIYVHPVRPWWWTLEMYTVFILCVFAAEYEKFAVWQTILGLAFGAVCLITSFKTMLSNPGICPRPPYDEAVENYENIQQNPTFYRRKLVDGLNGKLVEFSYCYRCNTYRPPSAGHCGICDCCIRGWDHHCPVFGGCVGYKNKRAFFFMAFCMPLFWVFMIALTGITVLMDENKTNNWYENLTFCFTIVAFLGALIVPPLTSCCCRCLDRAHTTPMRASSSRWFQGGSASSIAGASYPRQPPLPSQVDKDAESSKRQLNEDLRSNNNAPNATTTDDVEINFVTH